MNETTMQTTIERGDKRFSILTLFNEFTHKCQTMIIVRDNLSGYISSHCYHNFYNTLLEAEERHSKWCHFFKTKPMDIMERSKI